MSDKIIDLTKYLKDRPRRGKKAELLDDVLMLVIRFTDDEKLNFKYDVMTPQWRNSKTARAILLETLLNISEDILTFEDPAVSTELKQEITLAFNRVLFEDDATELRTEILQTARMLDEKKLKKVKTFMEKLLEQE